MIPARRLDEIVQRSKIKAVRDLIDLWCEREPGRMQLDLASTLGVHPVTLSRWRSGERAVPDWTLASIASAVGVGLYLDSTDGWSIRHHSAGEADSPTEGL